jgi:hypothetical protein
MTLEWIILSIFLLICTYIYCRSNNLLIHHFVAGCSRLTKSNEASLSLSRLVRNSLLLVIVKERERLHLAKKKLSRFRVCQRHETIAS